jgi:hypothetical protein
VESHPILSANSNINTSIFSRADFVLTLIDTLMMEENAPADLATIMKNAANATTELLPKVVDQVRG